MNDKMHEQLDAVIGGLEDLILRKQFKEIRAKYTSDEEFAHNMVDGMAANMDGMLKSSNTLDAFLQGNEQIESGFLALVITPEKEPMTRISIRQMDDDVAYDIIWKQDWKALKLRKRQETTDATHPDAVLDHGAKYLVKPVRIIEYEESMFNSHQVLRQATSDFMDLAVEVVIDILKRKHNIKTH